MSILSPPDSFALQVAVEKLETQSLAMKIAAKLGVPMETLLHLLPKRAQASVGSAVNKALEQCLRIALKAGRSRSIPVSHKRAHTAAVAVSGAVGGFFGLPGLILELPITTTVMLHSIVEIAASQGEDLRNPESALACLEVFALGPEGVRRTAIESTYYATRTALAQVTREAASYVVQKGMTKESAPALISFMARIASRFGLEVSEKVAAELVPIAGAAGGLALNVLFSHHFQSIAEGHFTVRRLERKYGVEAVRREYEGIRRQLSS
jgi:EcsC protein family